MHILDLYLHVECLLCICFHSHLIWHLFSVQHIPSLYWLLRASWPIRPSRCHSSPSAVDHCRVILTVSPLWTLTAARLWEFNPPQDSRDFYPFLVSGSLLKDSWDEVLNELDCVCWIAQNCAIEGVFLLLCSEDGNIYSSPFWWHVKHFCQNGNQAHFFIVLQNQTRRKKGALQQYNIKNLSIILHRWCTFAAMLSFVVLSEKSYLLTVKLSI